MDGGRGGSRCIAQWERVTGLGQNEPEIPVVSQEEVSSGKSEQYISWISKRKLTGERGGGVCGSGLEPALGARVIVTWKAQAWPPGGVAFSGQEQNKEQRGLDPGQCQEDRVWAPQKENPS